MHVHVSTCIYMYVHACTCIYIAYHTLFQAPLDPDEEAQYAAEETERERHREQFERSKRSSRTPAIVEAAGQMIRTLSVSTS